MKEIIGYDKKYLVTGYDIENMILLTNIEYLCTEQKGCWKSDESFGKMILVGRQGTNNRIKKLSNDGWIEISTINIRGGKKRTLIWLNKEILQSSPSDIVKESTILPRLYCQYNDGTIDNITGSDNSIDISLDINLEVSDGANKQELSRAQSGRQQDAREIEITPQIRNQFGSSNAFKLFQEENSNRLYNNFIIIFKKQEEKITQHFEEFNSWMLDQFIEERKKPQPANERI